METSFHSVELNALGVQLQSLLGECPLRVQCAIRDERLIVLGQHPEDSALDPQHVLKQLERKIQSLQINFTQQVRLYLRRGRNRQPYAHRWFMIQPPPPPPPPPRRLPLPTPPVFDPQQATTSTQDYPDDVLQPPDAGIIAVAMRSPTDLRPDLAPDSELDTESLHSTADPEVTSTEVPNSAEPGATWFNASTSILDLEHPVLDAEMFRAIGLDEHELAFSSDSAENVAVASEPALTAVESKAETETLSVEPETATAAIVESAPAVNTEAVPVQEVIASEATALEPSQTEFAFVTEPAPEVIAEAQIAQGRVEREADEWSVPFTPEPSVAMPNAEKSNAEKPDADKPDTEEAVWVVGDAELDDLMSQLTASVPKFATETIEEVSPENYSLDATSESAVLEEISTVDTNPSSFGILPLELEPHFDDRSTESMDSTDSQEPHLPSNNASNNASDNLHNFSENPSQQNTGSILEFDTSLTSDVTFEAQTAIDAEPLEHIDFSEDHSDDYEALYASESTEFAFVLNDDAKVNTAIYGSEFDELAPASSSLDSPERSPSKQTSERMRQLSQIVIQPVRSQVDSISRSPLAQIDGRKAIAVGVTAIGMTGAVYTLTRPCVIGACPQIGTAQELGEKSSEMMQQAESWQDLERASTYLDQAVETLEPIPMWSGYASEARSLLTAYSAEWLMVEALLDVEEVANVASRTSQEPLYSLTDWERVRSLWQQAISQLSDIPSDSDLYAFSREQLRNYRQRMAWVEQQISLEENARASLDKAKQAAQLAEARQGSAQSLENWQFARVTWIVALDRLQLVPEDTLAFLETEPLTKSYQTSLDAVTRRVERERVAQQLLTQAEQQARIAQVAERRLDWQQAVSDWTKAIAAVEEIEDGTSHHPKAEDLQETYRQSLSTAKEKLLISERIQMELEKTCIGEIRICNLLSVGAVVKVGLDDGYVRAIDAARSSGNNSIQAVVTDHQLILRRALEFIANEYDLPVEVYNPENTLLERHSPDE